MLDLECRNLATSYVNRMHIKNIHTRNTRLLAYLLACLLACLLTSLRLRFRVAAVVVFQITLHLKKAPLGHGLFSTVILAQPVVVTVESVDSFEFS